MNWIGNESDFRVNVGCALNIDWNDCNMNIINDKIGFLIAIIVIIAYISNDTRCTNNVSGTYQPSFSQASASYH